MEPEKDIDLAGFAKKVRGLSEEAFMAKYTHPFLLVDYTPEAMKTMTFQTHGEAPHSEKGGAGSGPGAQRVKFLVKSDRNTFTGKITVGRTANNDVIIPSETVSKLHAYFVVSDSSKDNEAAAYIEDLDSSNGTVIRGTRIMSNKRIPIESGYVIYFGSVRAKYLSPADLLEFIDVFRRM